MGRNLELSGDGAHASAERASVAASPSCPSPGSKHLDPSSFGYYDAVYEDVKSRGFASSARVGSVEVVPPAQDAYGGSFHTTEAYAIMRFVAINSFTAAQVIDGQQTLVAKGNGGMQRYADMSGVMLGMHHFNNGIGSVVEEVEGINERCPVRFAFDDMYDSESSQTVAVDHFGRMILSNPDRPPSGLFGATRSAVSIPLAVLSGTYTVPQVSAFSTSTELDDSSAYRYFSRLIPSDAGTAQAVVDYLARPEIGVRHLGMLYVNDSYGSAFHQAIVQAALERDDPISVKAVPFSYSSSIADPKVIELQIQQLAETGYKYFFGVFFDEHYEMIMKAAYKFGIAGPGYNWIMSDGLSERYMEGRTYKKNSPLAIASQGLGILKAEGGRESAGGDRGYDRFSAAWYKQGADHVDYYNCKQPKDNTINDPSLYYKASHDFFTGKEVAPTNGAVFTYDSAIAMGLAACQLYEEKGEAYFDGGELFDRFVAQSFEGASGRVSFDPETTSRDPKSAFFVLYNANGTPSGKDEITFNVKTVAISDPDPSSSSVSWVSFNNEAYLYSDGTPNPPVTLPPAEVEMNQLTTGVRVIGFAVVGLVFALAVYCRIWTRRHRMYRVVKASQPQFLNMIVAGSIILGSTIIPLSYDDSVATQSGCDRACMSIPWLFNIGFVTIFSALFAKTWRLNQVLKNAATRRKIKVKQRDALQVFYVLLLINAIVLTVWTLVDPLKWVRVDIGVLDKFGRSIDSYGSCSSNNIIPFVVVLFVINFCPILLANYQAYKARNLSTEFAESKYIAIIFASIFQAVVIGLPILIIVSKDPAAQYIVLTFIIGAICLSTLGLMFFPKMMAVKEVKEGQPEQIQLTGSEEEEAVVEKAEIIEVEADVDDEDDAAEESGVMMNIWSSVREAAGGAVGGVGDAIGGSTHGWFGSAGGAIGKAVGFGFMSPGSDSRPAEEEDAGRNEDVDLPQIDDVVISRRSIFVGRVVDIESHEIDP